LINPPNRVLIWQSQLTANDFPPVCAMTGAPAETWRRFSFATTPTWAYFLGAIAAAIFARRASGYLPLTRACRKKLTLAKWVPLGLIPLGFLLLIGGVFVGPSGSNSIASTFGWLVFFTGFASLIVGVVGASVVRASFGPAGKVMERQPWQYDQLVELKRVHPAFVVAVQQHQHARAAQYAYAPQAPFLPESK
jgi:hypothetical protein